MQSKRPLQQSTEINPAQAFPRPDVSPSLRHSEAGRCWLADAQLPLGRRFLLTDFFLAIIIAIVMSVRVPVDFHPHNRFYVISISVVVVMI